MKDDIHTTGSELGWNQITDFSLIWTTESIKKFNTGNSRDGLELGYLKYAIMIGLTSLESDPWTGVEMT